MLKNLMFCITAGVYPITKVDDFVKSRKTPFFVIPAKAGSWSGAGAGIKLSPHPALPSRGGEGRGWITEFLDSGLLVLS